MERHTLFLLVGVLILAIVFFLGYKHFTLQYEGFVNAPSKEMAQLRKPEGNSTVPNTMPGAVSRNPTEALASFKDIAALLDTMKTFNTMYEMFLLNLVKQTEYTHLHSKSVAYAIKLQAQIDTGKIVDTLKFVTDERRKYKGAIDKIRRNEPLYKRANLKKAKKVTNQVISEKGPIKIDDLKHAISRAKREQKRIDDIRSEAPDFKQRSLILERIQLDLQQIHDKIMRKDMKESEIPIGKRELLTFLVDVEDPTSKINPVPYLSRAEVNKKKSQTPMPKKNNKKKDGITSNFQDYPEDRKIISFLEGLEPIEGFESGGNTNDDTFETSENTDIHLGPNSIEEFESGHNDLSDEQAHAIELAVTDANSKPASGFVGEENDDFPFIPSNKLEPYGGIDEGFSNFTNNYIHDSEDRDEEFKVSEKKTTMPKEYKKMLTQLKSSMRDMTWDMKIGVGYDPNVTIQRRLTERLNQVSNEIESERLSKTKLKAKFMELDILKQQLETYNRRKMASSRNEPESAYRPRPYGSANTSDNRLINKKLAPEYLFEIDEPSQQIKGKLDKNGKIIVKQELLTSIEKPLASNDYRIRPGYEMTSEEISKRGSRASFDPTLVGGPDYKKNVKFLCSQIKMAGLGEPREFGCIANQETDVGPEYSWKGNYKMVCSRLGNTWGEWYPEMFGCPKPDVSTTQVPKINADCSSNPPPPLEHPPKPKCGAA